MTAVCVTEGARITSQSRISSVGGSGSRREEHGIYDTLVTTSAEGDETEHNVADAATSDINTKNDAHADELEYAIRLTPFVDHSSNVPSFYFGVIERDAKDGSVILVGRYADKRAQDGSADIIVDPIAFKSKVVSRKHAEFSVNDGTWSIKDVGSSSGTFLNNIRLSPANQLSERQALNDGDILQFGLDYNRGGNEGIYKSVKVRVELNRSWRQKPSHYNVNALQDLRNCLAADSTSSHECSICLLGVAPCQSLFIAPCAHAWHYKCIRPVIVKSYPHFMCPNCRFMCDLEADAEVPDLSHLSIAN
jgi:hypothetical protein